MDWLRRFIGALLARVMLFEEWGWEPLQRMVARLMRLPPLTWLERRIAALPRCRRGQRSPCSSSRRSRCSP